MLAALTSIKEYIRSCYDAIFHPGYFIGIVAMLAVIISLNYGTGLYPGNYRDHSFFSDYLLFLLPFSFAYLLQWFYFKNDRGSFSRPWFWILIFTAPALFAFRVNFVFPTTYLNDVFAAEDNRFLRSVINYIIKVFLLVIPVAGIWYVKDRKHFKLYGIGSSKNNKLYFLLLAMMIPFILMAASTTDFLNNYPRAQTNAGLYPSHSVSKFLIFELAYGFDFVSIEFFFRGFLILAFMRYCGTRAIIPAACFYCCIHLGKPMAEAISSFFGGLLLGMITYHTLSIWGGLFIHIGIAWLMEVAAYVGHHF
jgi:hypothetical protein